MKVDEDVDAKAKEDTKREEKKSGASPRSGTKEEERREIEEAKRRLGLTVVEGRADAARAELEELVLAGPAAEDLGEVGRDPHPERRRG